MDSPRARSNIYVPLHTHSAYSLLDSACRIQDLVSTAASFGCPALALTDRDSLAGSVEFSAACRAAGLRPLIGAEVTLSDLSHLTLLVADDKGYSNLCRILSRTSSGSFATSLREIIFHADGLVLLSGCRRGGIPALLMSGRIAQAEEVARKLADAFEERFFIEIFHHLPTDVTLKARLIELANRLSITPVPTPNIHYIRPGEFVLWQAVASVRTLTLMNQNHPEKTVGGDYHFRSPDEMADLFGPEQLRATLAVAQRCRFEL